MSAVPNVPEPVIQNGDHGPDAALRHALHNKQTTLEDLERVDSKVAAAHTNGTTNGISNRASPRWQLHDRPIENQRPIKVIVIGAGYSGIYLGIRIPERIRNCELTIYDKNDGIGGTW